MSDLPSMSKMAAMRGSGRCDDLTIGTAS